MEHNRIMHLVISIKVLIAALIMLAASNVPGIESHAKQTKNATLAQEVYSEVFPTTSDDGVQEEQKDISPVTLNETDAPLWGAYLDPPETDELLYRGMHLTLVYTRYSI